MSLGADCIASLDDALAEAGTTIKLRRIIGASPNQTWVDVTLPASIRSPTAEELVAGFLQTDSVVILSPTSILAAQWPGGQPPGQIHPELPKGGTGGDKVFVLGTPRQVEAVNPVEVGGVVARIELRVKG